MEIHMLFISFIIPLRRENSTAFFVCTDSIVVNFPLLFLLNRHKHFARNYRQIVVARRPWVSLDSFNQLFFLLIIHPFTWNLHNVLRPSELPVLTNFSFIFFFLMHAAEWQQKLRQWENETRRKEIDRRCNWKMCEVVVEEMSCLVLCDQLAIERIKQTACEMCANFLASCHHDWTYHRQSRSQTKCGSTSFCTLLSYSHFLTFVRYAVDYLCHLICLFRVIFATFIGKI